MKTRHGEVICEGAIEPVRALEQLIIKSGLGTVLHDASKGRHMMTGDYTARSAFSKVYEIRLNGEHLKLRFWFDKRDNTACVKAIPWHMAKLKRGIPGLGKALWVIVKSHPLASCTQSSLQPGGVKNILTSTDFMPATRPSRL